MSNVIPLFPPKPAPTLDYVMRKFAAAWVAGADDNHTASGAGHLEQLNEIAALWADAGPEWVLPATEAPPPRPKKSRRKAKVIPIGVGSAVQ
jgi:hypothetical protein